MEVIFKVEKHNTRRMKRLTLEANSFEEERILRGLSDVMQFGGSLMIEINGDPIQELVCSFEGETNGNA